MARNRLGQCIGVSLVTLSACRAQAPRPPVEGTTRSPRVVRTAAVARSEGGETSVPGIVRARQRAALSARTTAAVVESPYHEGERVEATAVLLRLDDTALRSAVQAAEAALAGADADRERAQALLTKDAATPRELEEAAARAAAARAAWEGARDNLAYAVLRAPFPGRVRSKPASVGEVVSPGMTLIEIEGDAGLELEATLDSSLAASIRPGDQAEAEIDGQAGRVRAMVRSVSSAADPATHRFEMRADLTPLPGLRSGLFARLLLPDPLSAPRLTVPASAVMERGGLSGVFVVAEGKARLRWIALGATSGGQTEARAGLVAGERVILDPAGLADAEPVVER